MSDEAGDSAPPAQSGDAPMRQARNKREKTCYNCGEVSCSLLFSTLWRALSSHYSNTHPSMLLFLEWPHCSGLHEPSS